MVRRTPSRSYLWHTLALLGVLFILLAEFAYMSQAPLLSDESFNFRQVSRFLRGDYSLEPLMNIIPGYHAAVALALGALGKAGAFSARLFSTLISLASVGVFYLLVRKIHAQPSIARTLQFAFLPLLFPFFTLIYADILAVLLVLLAFYLVLGKHYTLAGLVGILSVLVRTNNIAWFAFLYVYTYYGEYGLDIHQFPRSLRQTWSFWLGFGLFVAFLLVNGGIALGDKSSQPLFKFESGNLSFLLFLFALLLLPLNLERLPDAVRWLRDQRWAVPAVQLVALALFLVYQNTHPYNNSFPDYYLRNGLLMRMVSDLPLRAVFILLAALSLPILGATRFVEKSFYWLYPFTVISLVPFWLVEPRYYFVPFSLFLLFRQERQGWVEWLQVGYGVLFSMLLLYYIRNSVMFI